MATGIRRQARVIALQTLYEYDTVQHPLAEVLQRHAEDRHLQPKVFEYANELVLGVCNHLAEIDAHIQSAAREWPLQQMARIDKNILRLAIYEILFNNTVPAKAAINEAVELAKQFGSNTSSRFVNGVLGTIFHRAQQSQQSQQAPTPIAESEVK
jgi:N utilization substance protein B